jgi:hypothetical protein
MTLGNIASVGVNYLIAYCPNDAPPRIDVSNSRPMIAHMTM